MGYFTAGFVDILGVDIHPKSDYPFEFVQADAIEYGFTHGAAFDAIHASPPCQVHSATASIVRGRGLMVRFDDMVPQTRLVLEHSGRPWIIENVVGAGLINPVILCGEMFGLDVIRHRAFEANFPLIALPHIQHRPGGTNTTSVRRGGRGGQSSKKNGATYITVAGNNYNFQDGQSAMGITWMANKSDLSEAIPPAYTEYLGRQLVSRVLELKR